MEFADILSFIQTLSIIIALLVGCSTLLTKQNGKITDLTEMRMDIKYIKDTISKIDPIDKRLTEVEVSAKSAHKRIDEHIKNHRNTGGN